LKALAVMVLNNFLKLEQKIGSGDGKARKKNLLSQDQACKIFILLRETNAFTDTFQEQICCM